MRSKKMREIKNKFCFKSRSAKSKKMKDKSDKTYPPKRKEETKQHHPKGENERYKEKEKKEKEEKNKEKYREKERKRKKKGETERKITNIKEKTNLKSSRVCPFRVKTVWIVEDLAPKNIYQSKTRQNLKIQVCWFKLELVNYNFKHIWSKGHKTRQDKTRTRQDKTRQDKTRQDKTRQDKTKQTKQTKQNKQTKQTQQPQQHNNNTTTTTTTRLAAASVGSSWCWVETPGVSDVRTWLCEGWEQIVETSAVGGAGCAGWWIVEVFISPSGPSTGAAQRRKQPTTNLLRSVHLTIITLFDFLPFNNNNNNHHNHHNQVFVLESADFLRVTFEKERNKKYKKIGKWKNDKMKKEEERKMKKWRTVKRNQGKWWKWRRTTLHRSEEGRSTRVSLGTENRHFSILRNSQNIPLVSRILCSRNFAQREPLTIKGDRSRTRHEAARVSCDPDPALLPQHWWRVFGMHLFRTWGCGSHIDIGDQRTDFSDFQIAPSDQVLQP